MQLTKPDILHVIEREGLHLRRTGRTYRGKCPLHDGKSGGSLSVDPERQSFTCFGCGARGDVIAFIQAHRKCSFRDALHILGIEGRRRRAPDHREIERRRLLQAFRLWCRDTAIELARELRSLRRIVADIGTAEDLDLRGWAYHEIVKIEYRLDVLQYGEEEGKFLLYSEVTANGSA